jgi:uncharacterized protein
LKPGEAATSGGKEEGEKGRGGEGTNSSAADAAKAEDEHPLFAGLTEEPSPTPSVEAATAAEAAIPEAPAVDPFELHVSPIVSVDPSIAATSETPETIGSPIVDAASESAPAADATLPAPSVAAEAKPPQAKEKKKDKKKKKPVSKAERKAADLQRAFRDYFQYSESVGRVPPHRVLAINRGEKIKVLRVRIDSDTAAMEKFIDDVLVPRDHPHAEFLRGCGRDALHRLVLPSLERELRREMTDAAELHAVEVFAKNLRNLLLQPPVRERRLLALDPGFKSGCKWVALDEFGNLLEHGVTFVIGNAERRTESRAKLVEAVKQHQSSVIVIGNGTACRETENFVSDLLTNELAGLGVSYVIVSECGASVYSASPLGREEFPDCDATVRGAVSIGRRLQDPLSELVKIDPASLGVGLYQHDVKAKHLRDSLDGVVEWCVNYVGVDLNTAGPALLRYVSGLNQLTAQRIYEHRKEHGPFRDRAQLKEVSGIGEAAFVQAAGFLKITGGDNPLDVTWIHPESYAVAERLLEQLGADKPDLLDKEKVAKLAERARGVDMQRTSLQLKVGTLTLHDIITQLTRPGRDPRDSLPPPIFKQGILKLDDLVPGMELRGTVLNVVDFGAFVDIGLKDSGLVHISQLADKYVKDPHEVVSVGDVVKVWVLEVDKQRRRVSLTMIAPGSKRAEAPPHAGERPAPQQGDRPRGRDRGPQQGRDGQGRGDGGRRFGGKPAQGGRPGGGRPEGGGSGRRDRRPPRREQEQSETPPPVVEVKSTKPPTPAKLTKAKLQGRAYLQSFGELTQFLTVAKPADVPPPVEVDKAAVEAAEPPVADAPASAPPEDAAS